MRLTLRGLLFLSHTALIGTNYHYYNRIAVTNIGYPSFISNRKTVIIFMQFDYKRRC